MAARICELTTSQGRHDSIQLVSLISRESDPALDVATANFSEKFAEKVKRMDAGRPFSMGHLFENMRSSSANRCSLPNEVARCHLFLLDCPPYLFSTSLSIVSFACVQHFVIHARATLPSTHAPVPDDVLVPILPARCVLSVAGFATFADDIKAIVPPHSKKVLLSTTFKPRAQSMKDEENEDDLPAEWCLPLELSQKMSIKEQWQLSARNFWVRRKDYISTLAERDPLVSAIRAELGSTQAENLTLRQKVAVRKHMLLDGMGAASALGVQFGFKLITLRGNDETIVKLQCWDNTSGTESLAIMRSYYWGRRSDHKLTAKIELEQLEAWLRMVQLTLEIPTGARATRRKPTMTKMVTKAPPGAYPDPDPDAGGGYTCACGGPFPIRSSTSSSATGGVEMGGVGAQLSSRLPPFAAVDADVVDAAGLGLVIWRFRADAYVVVRVARHVEVDLGENAMLYRRQYVITRA
ncbi:hypothetical protein B0H11DRAFT_2250202 [Mycena galericulata]|nr:hypothetical protein B0H11DRAFT_2250202 [Mycena galericulata]